MESRVTRLRWRKQSIRPIKTERSSIEDARVERMMKEQFSGEEPLSPSACMFHQPHFNVHVVAVMGCATTVDPLFVKQKLEHSLLKHPRFVSLQVVDEKDGTLKWVPTKVDLDDHVIAPHVDMTMMNMEPSSSSASQARADKFVEDYIYNLSKTTLDKSKPLWDLHILNVKTSDAEAVGVFRIHHSLGDGTSLMSLLLACTRQIDHPHKVPTTHPLMNNISPERLINKSSDNGGGGGLFWGKYNYLAAPWLFLRLIWNTLIDVSMFMLTCLFLKDTNTPIKGVPGSEFNPRRIVYRTLSFHDFKSIKNAMNMTINDVAVGVTQAGLTRYLTRRYGDGDEGKNKKNSLPQNIRLRSTLLINLRPSGGIQDLADMMEKDTEARWGNWIGYVLLPFTIAPRDDPLDYVREAKATIDRKKNSLEAIYTFYTAEIVLRLFGIKAASALSHRILKHTTMCFSNLVGPLEEIGFYGHPLAYIAPSSYGQPHALMINFQSYVNKMTMVVSVDTSVISDPHQLLDDLQHSLNLIKQSAITKGLIEHHP